MGNDSLLVLLAALGVALLVFLIFREFWCWYWKQSEQVALLKSIDRRLEVLTGQRGADTPGEPDGLLDRLARTSYPAPPARG